MKNNLEYVYNKKTVGLTGQEDIETDGTDIKIASGDLTIDTGDSTTLATIDIIPGSYALIGDVDYFTNSTTGGKLTATYTDPITNKTVNRYLLLTSAGYILSPHDFNKHPYLAVFNPTSSSGNLTVSFITTSTTTSSEYICNVAYALRIVKE